MSRRKNEFEYSLKMNNRTYVNYFQRLRGIAQNRVIWDGLPSTVSARYFNQTIFEKGRALLFRDPELGVLGLPFTGGGSRTVYNQPIERSAYSVTGYHYGCDPNNSVIVYANTEETIPAELCELYALKLYEIDRAIDTNVKAQKTPVLIQCDEKERLTFENLWQQYDGNQAVIFANNRLNADGVKVLSTHSDYKAGDLQTLKERIWNEALAALGVANLSETKRERMIKDEVARSVGGAFAARASVMAAAEEAANQARDVLGIAIEPHFNDFAEGVETDPPDVVEVLGDLEEVEQ